MTMKEKMALAWWAEFERWSFRENKVTGKYEVTRHGVADPVSVCVTYEGAKLHQVRLRDAACADAVLDAMLPITGEMILATERAMNESWEARSVGGIWRAAITAAKEEKS